MFEIGTGSLLPAGDLVTGNIPRISAKSDSNGILGYFDTEDNLAARHSENFITVNFFGADGGVFYHPYIASVEMKVHTLKLPSIGFNSRTGNFIAAALSKSLNGFGYGSQLSSSKLKNSDYKIQLPMKGGEIDFDFIESFMIELETINMRQLEVYLFSAGLNDYILSSKDKSALGKLETTNWASFKIEDVLDWQMGISELNPLHLESLSVSEEKKYPFYGQSTSNNGVIEYRHLKDDVLNNKLSIPTILIHSNNQNTVYLETPFYLKDGHGATSVLQSEHLDKMSSQFIITTIKKVISKKFAYNNKATKIALKNTEISLPVKSDGTPDYDYMNCVISSIQKLVIKDVVLYADKMS